MNAEEFKRIQEDRLKAREQADKETQLAIKEIIEAMADNKPAPPLTHLEIHSLRIMIYEWIAEKEKKEWVMDMLGDVFNR